MSLVPRALGERASFLAQVGTGILIGLVSFAAAVPRRFWFAGADGFAVFEDQWLHIASLRYFIWDDWHWPVALASRMGRPPGTTLVFTDAIPLYGLVLRAARRAISPEFNFLGVWLALCYALQGAAAVVAMRAWGVRRWLPCIAGALFAVCTQTWMRRFAHAALSFHAPILLAVALIGAAATRPSARFAWAAVGLCWLSLAVNAYVFLMVAILTVVLLVESWLTGWPARRCLAILGVITAGSLLEAWALGFFLPHSYGAGFSGFSMNVLAPVYPSPGSLLGRWFRGDPDATGGQYEGFNYLGLGLLLLLPLALWLARSDLRRLFRVHWPLAAACGALTLWSFSNHVYLGHRLVLSLPSPPEILTQFRAPGRFFWPVTYTLLVFAVVAVAKAGRVWWLALAAAAAIQWADAAGNRGGIQRVLENAQHRRLDKAAWVEAIRRHDLVQFVPSWECATPEQRSLATEIGYLASIPRTAISSVYTARPVAVDCAAESAAVGGGKGVSDRTLLVALDGGALPQLSGSWLCASFHGGRACSQLRGALGALNAGTP
jgi:uncharacterized protein DUF6311